MIEFNKSEDKKIFEDNLKIKDSKACFYKCEIRNLKMGIEKKDLIDFSNCVNKCLDINQIKENITDFYFKQANEYINNPKIFLMKENLKIIKERQIEINKLNDIYSFEDYRFSTEDELKYEDLKKQETGSLFGRNK
jgi:hypothetical protein